MNFKDEAVQSDLNRWPYTRNEGQKKKKNEGKNLSDNKNFPDRDREFQALGGQIVKLDSCRHF